MRKVEILSKQASLSIVTDRSVIPPFGVCKGQSAFGQRWSLIRNGVEKPFPFAGKTSNFKLKKGDIVKCLTAGGGGYGDPLDRNPDSVGRDVIEGYVSFESAKEVYGVVLNRKDPSVNEGVPEIIGEASGKRERFSLWKVTAPLFTLRG